MFQVIDIIKYSRARIYRPVGGIYLVNGHIRKIHLKDKVKRDIRKIHLKDKVKRDIRKIHLKDKVKRDIRKIHVTVN